MDSTELDKMGKCSNVFFRTYPKDNIDERVLYHAHRQKVPEHSIVLTTEDADHEWQILKHRIMWYESPIPDRMYKELLAENGEGGSISGINIRKLSDIKEQTGM